MSYHRTETFVCNFKDQESFSKFFDMFVRNPKALEEHGVFVSVSATGDRVKVLDECQEFLGKIADDLSMNEAEQAEELSQK